MSNPLFVRLSAALGVVVAAASMSHAALYSWSYAPGLPQPPAPGGYQVSSAGGAIQNILSTFDSSTQRLTFDVQFGPPTGGSTLQTEGFWLVLNGGPNPKNQPGNYAILYFDGRSFSGPKLTVYGYNGLQDGSSWNDGNGSEPGAPIGDLIKGSSASDAASFINSISAGDSGGAGGVRRFAFDIDAKDILQHTPVYPAPDGSPWLGTGFGETLGIRFHAFQDFDAVYMTTGRQPLMRGTSFESGGYLDGSFLPTVPGPAGAPLLAMAGVLAARRRR